MRFLIQRVKMAEVEVANKVVGKIDKGFLVLIGITHNDTKQSADYLIKKLINLRIFEDENEKMNLSLKDVNGELLLVSQFTLYGDTKKGNRPSFIEAARPEMAINLYNYIIDELKKQIPKVETGIFGADMQVKLVNDGPVTILLEEQRNFITKLKKQQTDKKWWFIIKVLRIKVLKLC